MNRRCGLLLAMFVLAVGANSQEREGFRIAGRVVRNDSNRIVKGARVSIALVNQPGRGVSVMSGENGEFSFGGLPVGKYTLAVNDRGWGHLFQQHGDFSTGVAVGPGQDTEHIVFRLQAPASVAGRVLEDGDEPVEGATVYLFGQIFFNGSVQMGLKGQTNTASNGAFRFGHLGSGTYYVGVVGRPWYAQNFTAQVQPQVEGAPGVSAGPAVQGRGELDVAYPVTYYAGSTSPEGATPVKLQEGTRAEIQINLRAVPAMRVTFDGLEQKPDGQQNIQTSVTQAGPGGVPIAIPAFTMGNVVTGLAPGNYIVSAKLWKPEQQMVSLGEHSISVLGDTSVHPGGAGSTAVRGKVLIDGALTPGLAMLFRSVVNGNGVPAFVSNDGSFETELPPGRYVVILANTRNIFMQSVTAKGGSYANGELEIGPGAQVELIVKAGQGLSPVSGLVRKGKVTVSGAMVLLIPQDLSHGRMIPRDQSDSDGTFLIGGVIPGRYTLVAVEGGNEMPYADAAVMAPYLNGGRVVDVPLAKDAIAEVEVQARR